MAFSVSSGSLLFYRAAKPHRPLSAIPKAGILPSLYNIGRPRGKGPAARFGEPNTKLTGKGGLIYFDFPSIEIAAAKKGQRKTG